ncbi:MAG: hypothetical protein IH961_04480 [Chloroflexi bacterium]|nr:hypothetical protein [Chloroflexota bacterium]
MIEKPGSFRLVRRAGAAILIACISALVVSSGGASANAASGTGLTGLFGTVVAIGSDSMTLGTDDGVVILKVAANTSFKVAGDEGALSDIKEGDRIATTVLKTAGDNLVAENLLVRPRSGAQTRHIVGVVLEAAEDRLTLVDRSGKIITLDFPAGQELPAVGEAVTVVARKDELTNRLIARATERLEQTIARIEVALRQIEQTGSGPESEKGRLLRSLIEENSRRHLTALRDALGRSESGPQGSIRTNLLRFHTQYSAAADLIGNEAPGVTVSGVVSEATGDRITITAGDGSESVYTIGAITRFDAESDGRQALFGPHQVTSPGAGDRVIVEFSPLDSSAAPFATHITIKQPELSTALIDTLQASENRQFVGVVTRVDLATDLDDFTGIVTITNEESGRKLVLKTNEATGITLDGTPEIIGNLVPGLGVAVSLDSSGLLAVDLSAWSRVDRERHVRGVIKLIDLDRGIIGIAPERGPLVVVGISDDGVLSKNGRPTAIADLRIGDLVLNATRFDVESGKITNIVARSPQLSFTGVIRGVDRDDHSITVETAGGDPVKVLILSSTEFSPSDRLRNSFADVEVGDILRQGEFRIANVSGTARNVASLLVLQPARLTKTRGIVSLVNPEDQSITIESATGELLTLAVPGNGARVKLSKDNVRVHDLISISEGDLVEEALYIDETRSILSLFVVTPGAIAVSGRIASVTGFDGLVVIATSDGRRLAVRPTGESRLVRDGKIVSVTVFNTGDEITRILYQPSLEPDGVSDGDIITLEAVSRDRVKTTIDADTPVRAGRPPFAEIRLSGTLRTAGEDKWTVDGRHFFIGLDSAVHGNLEDGSVARVTARSTDDGTFEAIIVEVTAPPPPPAFELPDDAELEFFEFSGEILLIRQNTLFADGRRFLIIDQTVIDGEPVADALFDAEVARAENGDLILLTLNVHEKVQDR